VCLPPIYFLKVEQTMQCPPIIFLLLSLHFDGKLKEEIQHLRGKLPVLLPVEKLAVLIKKQV
jgi:hypothetical protein